MLPLILIAPFFISCATTGTPTIITDPTAGTATILTNEQIEENFDKVLVQLKPTLILAGKIVMIAALSPEDRIEKAQMLNSWGDLFRKLTGDKIITPDEFEPAISAFYPTSKTHWAELASLSTAAYAAMYAWLSPYIDSDYQFALKLSNKGLNFLAETAYAVGAAYLD